jgi:hypothetical protein
VTCYTQPCNPYKVICLLHYLPLVDESSPRGRWSICAPALPEVFTILSHGGLWLEDRRVEGTMYEGVTIKKTTNIGIAKVRCSILTGYGIVTSAHTKQQIVEERKMTSNMLMKLQYNVKDAILGDAPAKFDH